jgi:hypothetical protein
MMIRMDFSFSSPKEMPMKNIVETKLDLNYVLNKDRVQNNAKGKKAFKVI